MSSKWLETKPSTVTSNVKLNASFVVKKFQWDPLLFNCPVEQKTGGGFFKNKGWRVRVENIGCIMPPNDLEINFFVCLFWKIGKSMAWHVHNVHKNTQEASKYLGGSSKPIFIFTPILREMIQIEFLKGVAQPSDSDHQSLPMMSQEWWGVYATEAGTNPQAWCWWRVQVTFCHPRNWATRYSSGN